MKKKKLSKLVLKISDGLSSALIDLVLWQVFFLLESTFVGSPAKIKKAAILAEKDLQKFGSISIKQAIKRAQLKGFIKEDFTLTKEGKERLENLAPKHFGERKWDGKWRLVTYDIPEQKRSYREILRNNLDRLGFGQLQKSVRISPFNFLGEIEKIVNNHNLFQYVILVITDKLGREEPSVLAERVWNLHGINQEYKELLEESEKKDKKHLYFQYMSILRRDPQLPMELLPKDWAGSEAYQLFKWF